MGLEKTEWLKIQLKNSGGLCRSCSKSIGGLDKTKKNSGSLCKMNFLDNFGANQESESCQIRISESSKGDQHKT